ncbi:Pak3, partial [Cordylochernes scorpioides]
MSLLNRLRPAKKAAKKDSQACGAAVSKIGIPFSVKHHIHVGLNKDTGKIEGLPEPWMKLLQQSNISTVEQNKHPEIILQALQYYTHSIKKKPEKFLATTDLVELESQEIARIRNYHFFFSSQ